MENLEPVKLQVKDDANEQLPLPPFTYERTADPRKATYRQWRISPVKFAGKENEPYTDEEITQMVKRERENKDWFLSEYWRKKGLPQEQLEFQVGNQPITIYNFNKETPFTEEHLARLKRVFKELGSHFPQILEKIRWILIDNIPQPSAFGDPWRYPWNGNAMRSQRAFKFLPRGMELTPHRIEAASNFEGTFIHESTHLIDREFEKEWLEKGFVWDFCIDHQDEWELRSTPDGKMRRFYNRRTNEMAPYGIFSLQPDRCVTYHARSHPDEDICESMVAYIYDRELLKRISSDKFDILQRHDTQQTKPEISVQRIPKNQIRLPEIKPETVFIM